MYDFGRTWTYEDYSAKEKSMHKQKEWRNELERMKISNVVRNIQDPAAGL